MKITNHKIMENKTIKEIKWNIKNDSVKSVDDRKRGKGNQDQM